MSAVLEHDYLTSEDMGLDNDSGARIYGNVEDDGSAVVTFVDYTDFHRDLHPELFDAEEGWMRAESLAILRRLAAERFGAAEVGDEDGDEPHVVFVWVVPDAAAKMTAGSVGESVWPAIAKVINETDPGTFGARYIYADVARELEAQR